MQITQKINTAVIQAASAMLSPYIPEISPSGLLDALKAYNSNGSKPRFTKPLTRQEVAALFNVSLQSVSRWLNDGTLRRIHIGKRAVRIDPESVTTLLENGIQIE